MLDDYKEKNESVEANGGQMSLERSNKVARYN